MGRTSVHVLMQVYAKCVYGQEEAADRRVEAALGDAGSADANTTQPRGRAGRSENERDSRRRPLVAGLGFEPFEAFATDFQSATPELLATAERR